MRALYFSTQLASWSKTFFESGSSLFLKNRVIWSLMKAQALLNPVFALGSSLHHPMIRIQLNSHLQHITGIFVLLLVLRHQVGKGLACLPLISYVHFDANRLEGLVQEGFCRHELLKHWWSLHCLYKVEETRFNFDSEVKW